MSTRRQRSQPRIAVMPEFEKRIYREAGLTAPKSPEAPTGLLTFGTIQECPKCGEGRRFFRRSWRVEAGWEWVEWNCRCGYGWSEETRESQDARYGGTT